MACTTNRLALSAAAIVVLLAVLVGGVAKAAASAPAYCVPRKAIPPSPLSGCVWYVASRSCDVVATMLPNLAVLKDMCCHQMGSVPAECRCRALRVMMERPLVVGAEPGEQRRCGAAQQRFAPAVVTEAECGLTTIHGRPFCNLLDAE